MAAIVVIFNEEDEVAQLHLPMQSTLADIEGGALDLLEQLNLPSSSCQVSIHRRHITECGKLKRGKVSLLSSH